MTRINRLLSAPEERADLEAKWVGKAVNLLDVQGRNQGVYRVSRLRAFAWTGRNGKRIVEAEATLVPMSNAGIHTLGRWFSLTRLELIPGQP